MCTSYEAIRAANMRRYFQMDLPLGEYRDEIFQDYPAPIIRLNSQGEPTSVLATFGMVPKKKVLPGHKHYATMNARAESVGEKPTYRTIWRKSQLCLIPVESFFEPNWETGNHIRWRIGMASGDPLAIAGLWRAWSEPEGESYSFTMLTINAAGHPVMEHFHKPGNEKRSVAIIRPEEYEIWLKCKDPEVARSFLNLYPAELLAAGPAPKEKPATAEVES
jgi:putative SOS response-associated peptidase YedK